MLPKERVQAIGLLLLTTLVIGCADEKEEAVLAETVAIAEPTDRVILSSEIEWEKLNPARGDASPQAGTIFGDRKGDGVATGFLAKFVDGFSSPPHIHNVTYRAFVISGLRHNDYPAAEKMWMPAGSFWIQPAGEAHITAAKGTKNVAYVEIDSAPYLVKPTDEAYDNGDRPINIHADNIVWSNLDAMDVKIAYLWGNPEGTDHRGVFIKLPADFNGKLHTEGKELRAVVVSGVVSYLLPGQTEAKQLDAGSSFSSEGKTVHQVSSADGMESVIYLRTNGLFRIR